MKTRLLLACMIAVVTIGLFSRVMSANQPDLKNVMKAKLAHTQSILEGLALEDFDRIKRGAQNLGTLSRAESWNIHKTPEYVKFSKDFQDLADVMVTHATAKKLEAVALDYVQLTMLCVKCHTHTRTQGVADAGEQLPDLLSLAEHH